MSRGFCFVARVEPVQAYSAVAVKPASAGRLLKAGIAVLVTGAVLLLLGAAGAFYFWNNSEKHVRVTFHTCGSVREKLASPPET